MSSTIWEFSRDAANTGTTGAISNPLMQDPEQSPGIRTARMPVSESTGMDTFHQRTGRSEARNRRRDSLPLSIPEPPILNVLGLSSTIAFAVPAPSDVATTRTLGVQPGFPAIRPKLSAISDTRSTIYCAGSRCRLATPTHTGSRQRARPRPLFGAATSLTKSLIMLSRGRPTTSTSSSLTAAEDEEGVSTRSWSSPDCGKITAAVKRSPIIPATH